MEDKKLDFRTIIGFILLFAITSWMFYKPSQEQQNQENIQKGDSISVNSKSELTKEQALRSPVTENDSLSSVQLKKDFGAFASAMIKSDAETVIASKLLTLTFSNKGGYLKRLKINGYKQFSKDSQDEVHLVKDANSALNLTLKTLDHRVLNTKDLYFKPYVSKQGDNQVLSMRLEVGNQQYLEYHYTLKPDDYMLDFSIKSVGLQSVLSTTDPVEMSFDLKTIRNEKSISYENRYTELVYEYEDGKDDYLNANSEEASETADDVTYFAFKQHLFTTILLTDSPFKKVDFRSVNLNIGDKNDSIYTKEFYARVPLEFKSGELSEHMNLYYGPSDYQILNNYDRNLDEVIPLGWGIFGWINRYLFIPVFGLISSVLPYGVAIILFTILVRIVMSPITYKSYLSQAKMKVIRPEVQEINEKYKKEPMKRQQETMKLYSKAGVSPMAGCVPALMQIPIFYALFQFFPSVFDLRQKSFLWADDLSSYDAVFTWDQQIPVISFITGNHISLFPILASVAIFFYMRMTTGDQTMSAPTQEGMPDMSKIMKTMIYISPVMMLFFFNNYASGLSLYYFISNLITIGIMLVIKNYIIDNDKIHAKIQQNKAKPKKEGKFQKKMREMMEQAEAQQKQRKK